MALCLDIFFPDKSPLDLLGHQINTGQGVTYNCTGQTTGVSLKCTNELSGSDSWMISY